MVDDWAEQHHLGLHRTSRRCLFLQGSVMGRRAKRQVGAMSWGFAEDRLEDLGVWEPSDLDLHHVSTP